MTINQINRKTLQQLSISLRTSFKARNLLCLCPCSHFTCTSTCLITLFLGKRCTFCFACVCFRRLSISSRKDGNSDLKPVCSDEGLSSGSCSFSLQIFYAPFIRLERAPLTWSILSPQELIDSLPFKMKALKTPSVPSK